jgi:hypothetical protein
MPAPKKNPVPDEWEFKGNKLWERQKIKNNVETVRAYEAFQIYRDLGPERSFPKVAAIMGVSRQQIGQWSMKYFWTARIIAWEDELAKRRTERIFKETEEMHLRHFKQAKSIATSLMVPVEAFLKKILTNQKTGRKHQFDHMTERELFKLIENIADKLPKVIDVERKSRGEPTNIDTINIDFSKMSDDELLQIANSGQ